MSENVMATEQRPVIEIQGLSFTYDGLPALENVNVTVMDKSFVCMVGPNGGGKTTLLKLILGLLKPTRGTVRVFGQGPERVRSRIGYVPQHSSFDFQFPVRVIDVVLMGQLGPRRWLGPYRRSDKAVARDALREVELYDVRSRPFASLSGGQRQRVLIARALATQPEILLLDEPMANVDAVVERALEEVLQDLNRRLTIVMVTHDVGFASAFVDHVVCVNRKVAIHPTSELTGELLREIYGSDVRFIRHDKHCEHEV